jgi:hypothetical protein
MTSYARYQQLLAESKARFTSDTTDHEMTVLHDDGLYRHVRFAEPGTGMYSFNLITWPGYLTICGDMPVTALTFRRLDDMFAFFRQADINPGYWAEKLCSGRDAATGYSEGKFRLLVDERVTDAVEADPELEPVDEDRPGLVAAVAAALEDEYDPSYEETAREFLQRFTYDYTDSAARQQCFQFRDTWEWDLTEYDWSFLWACHAIRWGVEQYTAARGVAPVETVPVAPVAPVGVETLVAAGGVL